MTSVEVGMRIALVGARSFPARHGGIERAVESLATEYVRQGHEVTVLVADDEGSPATDNPRVLRVPALPGKYTMALSQALTSVLRTSARGLDLVHVHGIGPGMVVPLLAARGLPVVLTVHALDFERDKWPPAAQRLFKALSRPGVRRADRVVCVGEHLADDVARLYGVRSTVIPNGVTLTRAPDAPSPLAEHGLAPRGYLLFVGRLVPEKRVDVLLRAHAAAGAPCPLVVVGGGSGSYAGDYEDEVRSSAPPGVLFLGEQPHDVVCALIDGAAALVNPSRLEGLPLTVLEARVLGTPTVLSDIAPHRELAGASSTLVPVDDVVALTEALRRAVDARDAVVQVAQAESADARSTWSWEAVAQQTLDLYDGLLAERSDPGDRRGAHGTPEHRSRGGHRDVEPR